MDASRRRLARREQGQSTYNSGEFSLEPHTIRTYLTFCMFADPLALDWTPFVAASPDASKATLRAIRVSHTRFTYYEKKYLAFVRSQTSDASRRRLSSPPRPTRARLLCVQFGSVPLGLHTIKKTLNFCTFAEWLHSHSPHFVGLSLLVVGGKKDGGHAVTGAEGF